MPDAYATFGANERPIAGSYTASWGTSPGQARLSVGAGFGQIGQVGNLKFFYRGQSFTLRDAIIADPTISFGAAEIPRADFVALDRRWKWQFGGAVYGDFNFEKKDGTLLREASPRALASKLFTAMGETNGGVRALPDSPRPRVVWDAASPREELNRLCADFGCVVCFDHINDNAYVAKIGVGQGAQGGGQTISRSDALIWPQPPDAVRVVGGISLFQTALALGDSVGREVDGSYVKINDLSYKPPGGWSSLEPWQFNGLDTEYTDPPTGETLYHRNLAQSSVWRCYRISGQKAGGFSPAALAGGANAPASILDLGPFTGSLLDKDAATNERLPCYARGTFADERFGYTNSKPNTRFPGSISIDSERRIVTFDKPLFKYDANDHPEPADVVLIAAYSCTKDGVPIRYSFSRPTGYNNNTGELIERHDSIVTEHIEKTASGSGADRDNSAKVNAEMNYYLDAHVDRYQNANASQVTYGGFQLGFAFALDGVLRSVTYTFSTNDTPKTQCSYNCERTPFITPWEQRSEARQLRIADSAARRAEAQRRVSASRDSVRKGAS